MAEPGSEFTGKSYNFLSSSEDSLWYGNSSNALSSLCLPLHSHHLPPRTYYMKPKLWQEKIPPGFSHTCWLLLFLRSSRVSSSFLKYQLNQVIVPPQKPSLDPPTVYPVNSHSEPGICSPYHVDPAYAPATSLLLLSTSCPLEHTFSLLTVTCLVQTYTMLSTYRSQEVPLLPWGSCLECYPHFQEQTPAPLSMGLSSTLTVHAHFDFLSQVSTI